MSAARTVEATLQAALASERVAAQEARNALQSVSASQASAEARVRELELSVLKTSGDAATLAAGAAAMAAVREEVAVLKSVVGSERQEHRQLVGALRAALGQAQERGGRDIEKQEQLVGELEDARRAQRESEGVVRGGRR